mmetsp:Transcript_84381/g.163876  ORF Transcript_84381/g.163876 Transcript_84381/m.163876 type:complete len:112 (-) Transcript_84381:1-336(-)
MMASLHSGRHCRDILAALRGRFKGADIPSPSPAASNAQQFPPNGVVSGPVAGPSSSSAASDAQQFFLPMGWFRGQWRAHRRLLQHLMHSSFSSQWGGFGGSGGPIVVFCSI